MDTNNPNLRYVVQFLRNGGETVRAIKLVVDCTGLGVIEAKDFVQGLTGRVPLSTNRCPKCLGTGFVVDQEQNEKPCPECRNDSW